MDLLRRDRNYSVDEMIKFISNCKRVYIYGAGKIASKLANDLKKAGVEWEAFIVTSNNDGRQEFMEHPVYGIDEISLNESDGVVLAIAEINQCQMKEKLNERNCPAKIFEQRIYSRIIKVPDGYLSNADKDKGFFSNFQILNQLGVDFDTDKQHKGHDYLRKYELFLQHWKDKEFTLLELGVFHGGSLSTWGGSEANKGYFSNARIVGVDINPDCQQYVHGQEVIIRDLGDQEQLSSLKSLQPSIIVDDASHFCTHQIMALLTLWESIPSGGIYIMEDIDTSFTHIGYVGFDDAVISAYDICRFIAESVTSGGMLRREIPLRTEVEKIAHQVDMISFIHGSCIIVKK